MRIFNRLPTSRRAFSITEIVIAVGLTSAFAVVMLFWVGSVGRLSSIAPAQSGAQQSVAVFTSTFQSDLDTAVGCDPQRRGFPVESIDAGQVALYVDEDADGLADRVQWSSVGGTVVREVYPATGPCSFATSPDVPKVMLSGLTGDSPPLFTPVADGVDQPDLLPLTCGGSPSPCGFSAIAVRAFVATDSEAPVVMNEVLPLNLGWAAAPGRIGPPGAPVLVSASGANRSISLGYLPSGSGGSPIVGWEYSTDDGSSDRSPDDPSGAMGNSMGVTKQSASGAMVVNGTTYAMRVRAVNAAGYVSAWSNMLEATPGTTPDPPSGVVCVPGNAQAAVSWAPPASDGGAAISSYRVTVFDAAGGGSFNSGLEQPASLTFLTGSAETSFTFPGLTNAAGYTFVVRAVNSFGEGDPSSLSEPCVPYTVPSAPTVAASGGIMRVDSSWGAPSGNGRPVTSYVLQYSSDASFSTGVTTVNLPAPSTTYAATGLADDTTYRVRVAAVNLAGQGPWSVSATATTLDPLVMSFEYDLFFGRTAEVPLNGTVNATVVWSNGQVDVVTQPTVVGRLLPSGGSTTAKVYGTVTRLGVNQSGSGTPSYTQPYALRSVSSFGKVGLTSLEGAFNGATRLTSVPAALPAGVTNLSRAFEGATDFNGDISGWDVSSVTTMREMFDGATSFNRNLSGWNTASLTDMTGTFNGASAFNNGQPLGQSTAPFTWDTSNVVFMPYAFATSGFGQSVATMDTSAVTNMNGMFAGATWFNQSVAHFNTSAVTNMGMMFQAATSFNNGGQSLQPNVVTAGASAPYVAWNTSSVANMQAMFFGATAFNQPIGGWNTSAVASIAQMFEGASAFNQPVNSNVFDVDGAGPQPAYLAWDTGNVLTMHAVFYGASSYGKDPNANNTANNRFLDNWDTSKVTDMSFMFTHATYFNGLLTPKTVNLGSGTRAYTSWNTGNVTSMSTMFTHAYYFNRNISAWNVSKVTSMNGTFANAFAFNQPIGNWNVADVEDMFRMFYLDRNVKPSNVPATGFNQTIALWNVSKVTNMRQMFYGQYTFNQGLGFWNVANVTDMREMFANNGAFNQNISGWNVSKVNSPNWTAIRCASPLTEANLPVKFRTAAAGC
jgi:surface protein